MLMLKMMTTMMAMIEVIIVMMVIMMIMTFDANVDDDECLPGPASFGPSLVFPGAVFHSDSSAAPEAADAAAANQRDVRWAGVDDSAVGRRRRHATAVARLLRWKEKKKNQTRQPWAGIGTAWLCQWKKKKTTRQP
ncbi:unnamed protein product [Lampetra fluviatilis]